MNQMSIVDIAWISGVFEGEGTFGIGTIKNKQGRQYHQVYTALHMTDEDIINRLHFLTGVGRVNKMTERPGQKQAYMWKVAVRKDVEDLVWAMMPFLGKRRSARAQEALAVINELKNVESNKRVPVCQYKDCQKDLSNRGPLTLYCSDSHKTMAYLGREKIKIQNVKPLFPKPIVIKADQPEIIGWRPPCNQK